MSCSQPAAEPTSPRLAQPIRRTCSEATHATALPGVRMPLHVGVLHYSPSYDVFPLLADPPRSVCVCLCLCVYMFVCARVHGRVCVCVFVCVARVQPSFTTHVQPPRGSICVAPFAWRCCVGVLQRSCASAVFQGLRLCVLALRAGMRQCHCEGHPTALRALAGLRPPLVLSHKASKADACQRTWDSLHVPPPVSALPACRLPALTCPTCSEYQPICTACPTCPECLPIRAACPRCIWRLLEGFGVKG